MASHDADANHLAHERRKHPRAPTASDRWATAITGIEPNRILIRGYPVDELMGRMSFGEAVYLLLRGELPSQAIGRLFSAVLKVHARTIPGARSNESLGAEREGTGVVIGEDGVILTIGYLVIEADQVDVTDSRGKTIPAKVLGYDHATGLALLRALTPLDLKPLAMGDSGRLKEREPVMVINYQGRDDVTLAFVVSVVAKVRFEEFAMTLWTALTLGHYYLDGVIWKFKQYDLNAPLVA
jgi:S1-C subfamily serine protease